MKISATLAPGIAASVAAADAAVTGDGAVADDAAAPIVCFFRGRGVSVRGC